MTEATVLVTTTGSVRMLTLNRPAALNSLTAAMHGELLPALQQAADDSRRLDCAHAIADAGATELVVHARTKLHGYRPPAYWDRIALIRQAVTIAVVANGEVWTAADAQRCMTESGCDALMLGRGLVSDPGLALALRGRATPVWDELLPLLGVYSRLIAPRVAARHRGGRIKQWLNMLRRRFDGAQVAYDAVRNLNDADAIDRCLQALMPMQAPMPMPLPLPLPAQDAFLEAA